jgi:aspartate-semialdehyde dehydrogenase
MLQGDFSLPAEAFIVKNAAMSYKIAVVGATGNVGREMLQMLAERNFPASEVVALASERSIGREVSYGETAVLKVQDLDSYDFYGTDIALFSPGAKVSAIYAPKAAEAGCVVIDNTSHFRMDPEVPLVVPEVNAHALAHFRSSNIIANPNCSTIQMVVALKPLHDAAGIKRVVVSTYQSVSGAGKEAMDELYEQTRGLFLSERKTPSQFSRQIAFNVIPQIDVFMDDDFTKEEWKMAVETVKIMEAEIPVVATCVRVPVFVGHAEAVTVELESPLSPEEAMELLSEAPGISLIHNRDDFITSAECAGDDPVFVSRVRRDPTVAHGLCFWVVADNLRKGAALNAIQIAETLISEYGLMPQGKVAA